MNFLRRLFGFLAPRPEIATSETLRAMQQRVLDVPAEVTGGKPMRVRICRLPRLVIESLRAQGQGQQEVDVVRHGLIEPKVAFGDGDPGGLPRWDDLPMGFRMFVATSILSFSHEGMAEVMTALRPFSGEDEVGAGDAGARTSSGQGVPPEHKAEHDSAGRVPGFIGVGPL